ncbi:cytochrome-c peroxidase [Ramlibacter rhizophilus]|uniref:Cytochrome-c peroxidase n=1 Tax=Ramlibacter rhizophilus TaxID=1781167 RepID=A0A4Z0BPQ8_9BURK|nr:cytochrome c peroxidase [Ramlibacter rhizophilus]TFY99968.1 cytochrome-c peroxidase [Ramlibacter rhizophilus]
MKPRIHALAMGTLWVALLGVGLSVVAAQALAPLRDLWSPSELQVLASMHIREAGPRPQDPSNAYESNPHAARLGEALFNDVRLSRNGRVSCASCHSASGQFEDGKRLGEGLARGTRRTMPLPGASHTPFLFWDGRKDSLWSQALGPMEDPAEHGGNRAKFARIIQEHYAHDYRRAFGELPALGTLPDASPLGSPAEKAAWAAMPEPTRDRVNRVFANMGKAIAAYESRISYGPSRFDRYVEATLARDGQAQAVFSPQDVRGLRVFLGKGQCVSCHNGPLMTDHAFHNTGVPPLDPTRPDRGRADGLRKLLADPFNCLGPYSDAKPPQCGELNFLSSDDPGSLAAFRTPSLRNVAARAPYMHAGQFATLEDVLRHYAESPRAVLGHSELARPGEKHAERQTITLGDRDIADLAAFLRTLDGPVNQPR